MTSFRTAHNGKLHGAWSVRENSTSWMRSTNIAVLALDWLAIYNLASVLSHCNIAWEQVRILASIVMPGGAYANNASSTPPPISIRSVALWLTQCCRSGACCNHLSLAKCHQNKVSTFVIMETFEHSGNLFEFDAGCMYQTSESCLQARITGSPTPACIVLQASPMFKDCPPPAAWNREPGPQTQI